jgi:superoxide dismutase, Fe-Mn family
MVLMVSNPVFFLNNQPLVLFCFYKNKNISFMKKKTFVVALLFSNFLLSAQQITAVHPVIEGGHPEFHFMQLPYAYDALEPFIDRMTMEIHYDRHHRGYFNNFMKAIDGTEWEKMSLKEIFSNMSKASAGIRNNGGGFYNHNIFWENLAPAGKGGEPSGELMQSITASFGNFDAFKQQFNQAALTRFGSGWAWLNTDEQGKLFISSTPNQDNPLMDVTELQGTPILGLDVWEHAYYLKYQNRRADYIDGFWNIINWHAVNDRYRNALNK